ncbi:MAG: guanine deaminase [Candidatus Cloacimonadales bacterium]|nr:guanine deaminase [Candidatus Cloacimonadales bacterium]
MQTFKSNLLNPISPTETQLLKKVFITLKDGKISSISNLHHGDYEDRTDLICIPGLIDTHVHLSQFYIRGSHSPSLLHWLKTYTFQEELKSKDVIYAEKVARDFFADSVSRGTTTSVIYTAPYKQACDIAFEVAQELGVRAIIGMTMMDANSPDYLQQDSTRAFEDSANLFDKWNRKTGLLEYVFTPRFALTCSALLMKITGDFARNENAYIQTHLSENKVEIKRALELFPQYGSYTEIYDRMGLLGPKTILGHVIHVDDEEISILKETESKIAHCPDSNFFLKSGMFPLQKLKEAGLDIALGSDVAGGTSLSMLNVMKMAAFRQNEYVIPPQEAFYYATLGGAKVLGKENIVGFIEAGKAADLVFLKIPPTRRDEAENILSRMIYTHEDVEIVETLVAGRKVF